VLFFVGCRPASPEQQGLQQDFMLYMGPSSMLKIATLQGALYIIIKEFMDVGT
jgi:hypothetical protein